MNPEHQFPHTQPFPHEEAPVSATTSSAAAKQNTSDTTAVLDKFARSFIREQRASRRWRLILRTGWLLLAAAVVFAMYDNSEKVAAPKSSHTAMVEIRGEISVESEASAERINKALRNAFEDESAKAVVLKINSPGGSPVQAGMINDEILRLKKLHQKPLYAVCEEMCASAAYYIAVGSDKIFVDKASIVGSIGVLMDGFGFTGTMEKLGVERRLITAGANKGLLDPYSPLKDEHRAFAQAMLDQIHQQFIAVVKAGRGNKLKDTDGQLFSGLFWNGEESINKGLADELGSMDYVAREVVQEENIIDYTTTDNVAERLAKKFGASIGAGAVAAMRSSVANIH